MLFLPPLVFLVAILSGFTLLLKSINLAVLLHVLNMGSNRSSFGNVQGDCLEKNVLLVVHLHNKHALETLALISSVSEQAVR